MLRILLLIALPALAAASSVNGLWDATVVVREQTIPFRIEFAANGAAASGWFLNGEERVGSTRGTWENEVLTLYFDHYGSRLEARRTAPDGWEGTYKRSAAVYPFRASRHNPVRDAAAAVPSIAGHWEVPIESAKGEAAWHLIIRQSGAEASAAILRVDGDTGTLSGPYKDGKWILSHFSGARPALLEVTPAPNGALELKFNGKTLQAVRSAEARAKGLPEPSDPARFTHVKDPSEPFRFSFPNLEGKLMSNTDAKFRDKVVLVNIGGSWCPNCHDEAPFLVELHRKFHKKGLEIVLLSFEEGEQLQNPERLRAFLARYGIEFTVLLAGEPSEAKAKLDQAVNFAAFPTTFFLGRDGRVKSVHVGFASRASGELHERLKAELTEEVERLLSLPVQTN